STARRTLREKVGLSSILPCCGRTALRRKLISSARIPFSVKAACCISFISLLVPRKGCLPLFLVFLYYTARAKICQLLWQKREENPAGARSALPAGISSERLCVEGFEIAVDGGEIRR